MLNDSNVDRDGLADYLAREFAEGGLSASRDDGCEFDANDVAAYARGQLFHGRRAAFMIALSTDPGLREAVAFEEAACRSERRRRVLRWAGVAAAAVIVALAIVPLMLDGSDPVSDARRLMADGDAAAAMTMLERTLQNPHDGQATAAISELLALARFANGDEDPLHDLDLGTRGDWAPLRDGEIQEPAQVRGDREPAIGVRGFLLTARPAIECRRGARPLMLVLYRSDDMGTTLFRHEVPGGDPGESVVVELPDTVSDLEPGARYGVELRAGRRLVAHSDFMIAERHIARSCQAVALTVSEVLTDVTQRHHALGNLFLRRGFYAEAVSAWSAIPTAQRTTAVRRALEITTRLLWNK